MERQVKVSGCVNGQRNYPFNCWWVAALGAEIGDALLSRRILEIQIVLYRGADGKVVALEDRCPHRSLPLSMGKRVGDTIVCGYHGFEFAATGKCLKAPSQASPGKIAVRSFPIREEGPFVWIYTGDVAVIDQAPPPPSQDWITDSAYNPQSDYMQVAGNHLLLKENVLDLTHFGYVHADVFDVPMIQKAPDFVQDGDTVGFREYFKGISLPPFFAEPIGLKEGQLVNMGNWGNLLSPAIVLGALDWDIIDPLPGQQEKNNFRICHATTPIDNRTMHYWWVFGRNFANDDTTMRAYAKNVIAVGFDQDKAVIEAIQRVYDADPRPLNQMEMSVAADQAGVVLRRIIQQWLARE